DPGRLGGSEASRVACGRERNVETTLSLSWPRRRSRRLWCDRRPLAEEEEDPEGISRVDERLLPPAAFEHDVVGVRARADHGETRRAEVGDGRVEVLDHQGELIHALATLGQEPADGVVRAVGRDE